MKAIKTSYGGVTFRSRLEARWAHAFDKHEIVWEYEPEWFNFELDGTEYNYLPDFLLPDSALYVEVKGSHNERLDKALAFGTHLAREYDSKIKKSDKSSRNPEVTYQEDYLIQRAYQTSPQLIICDDKGTLGLVILGWDVDEKKPITEIREDIGVFTCHYCKKVTLRHDFTEPRCFACGQLVHYTINGRNQFESFGDLPVMTEWVKGQ